MTVAKNVDSSVLKDCGHFFPEERPEEIVRHVQALKARVPIICQDHRGAEVHGLTPDSKARRRMLK